MKKLFVLLIFVTLLTSAFSVAVFAEENIKFSGTLETLWGAGAPWTDKDTAKGRMTLGETSFTGKIDSYFGNSSALVEGSAKYDSIEDSQDFSVDDCWLDYTSDFWGLRIGRQKTAWGKPMRMTSAMPSAMSWSAAFIVLSSSPSGSTIRCLFSRAFCFICSIRSMIFIDLD